MYVLCMIHFQMKLHTIGETLLKELKVSNFLKKYKI